MSRRDPAESFSCSSYRRIGSLPDPSVCPDCEATWCGGRWTWRDGPADAPRIRCSACTRIREGHPAGYVRLQGPFQKSHRDELDALIHDVERAERGEHPVNRIMQIREEEGDLVITTTEPHLARSIGSAIESTYQGELCIDYEDGALQIRWAR